MAKGHSGRQQDAARSEAESDELETEIYEADDSGKRSDNRHQDGYAQMRNASDMPSLLAS